jgi:hypothetical protein
MLRQRTVILLFVLAAGLAANLLVTMGCVLWSWPDQTPIRPATSATKTRMMDLWAVHRPPMAPAAYPGGSISEQRTRGMDHFITRNGHPRDQHTLSWFGAGWPLRTLEGGRWRHVVLTPDPNLPDALMITGGGGKNIRSVLLLPDHVPVVGFMLPVRVVPIGLAWRGLLVNTLLYAAPLAGLAWLLVVTRRRRRVARGQCPFCGYPVGSSAACTECGRTLPGAPAA